MLRYLLLLCIPSSACTIPAERTLSAGMVHEGVHATTDMGTGQADTSTWPPLLERDIFISHTAGRLCPRSHGPRSGLWPLDSADRVRILQEQATHYIGSDLYLFAKLPPAGSRDRRMTMLCRNDDGHDLLWISHGPDGRLNGLDTLASYYGDGQESVEECAYYDAYGRLMEERMEEATLRDDVDTMTYQLDTLLYECRVTIKAFDADSSGDHVVARYGLVRVPEDLTRRWVATHPVNYPEKRRLWPVRSLIPVDRRVLLAASGDLDGDRVHDHVFVLAPKGDDADRDLLIAFTTRYGFVRKALLPGLIPGRAGGGFHDPHRRGGHERHPYRSGQPCDLPVRRQRMEVGGALCIPLRPRTGRILSGGTANPFIPCTRHGDPV